MDDWTLDTQVLYEAGEANWDAAELLNRVLKRRESVVFDHEGHIESEYLRALRYLDGNAGPGALAVRKWFVEVVSKLAYKHAGVLNRKDQAALRALGFDEDDWPFVCVCSKSVAKRLVAEESDYECRVREYIARKLGVQVLAIRDACDAP